jgi:16S rRNA (uracil1498-N3)-methyltransferase
VPAPGDDGGAARTDVTPLTAKAHVFVDDVEAPRLTTDDHHHLARVLRLPTGSALTVGDGSGRWRAARMTRGLDVADAGEIVADARPAPALTVAFALVKGDRPELTVQKLTEVGVDRMVPFVAERSVAHWDAAKAERQHARLTAIARQAAVQCRRTWLPQVVRLSTFGDVASLAGAVMADREGGPPSLDRPVVLVGPEGGWSPSERASGLPRCRLSDNVLRADTAAITGGVLLAAMRAQLVIRAHNSNTNSGL